MLDFEDCIFTGLPIQNPSRHTNHHYYEIHVDGNIHGIGLCPSCYRKQKKYFHEFAHVIGGLILNDKIKILDDHFPIFHWGHDLTAKQFNVVNLKKLLAEIDYPKTPKEKSDYIISQLYSMSSFDGESIMIDGDDISARRFYLKNYQELVFYLDYLEKAKLLKNIAVNGNDEQEYQITLKGLEHAMKLQDEGSNSIICFVAMSFHEEDEWIYEEAIKPACDATGFEAKRMDKIHMDNEQTINDGMIALMKKCKFCIADFTGQRGNVYFEAGYVLGSRKKVIYTCHEKDFVNRHFDTAHFPHIKYDSAASLKEQLIAKIEAWIT